MRNVHENDADIRNVHVDAEHDPVMPLINRVLDAQRTAQHDFDRITVVKPVLHQGIFQIIVLFLPLLFRQRPF